MEATRRPELNSKEREALERKRLMEDLHQAAIDLVPIRPPHRNKREFVDDTNLKQKKDEDARGEKKNTTYSLKGDAINE